MDRRTLVRTSGLAALGLGLGGCATARARTGPVEGRATLPLVRASWDRVIRTTVGLRPHRPAGFRLEVEKLDDKTVIHNYGHGGAGISLSWGTGLLAAELAEPHPERRAAVLGCGAVGLAAARQLQRGGFDVTIYAMSVPPDTTSNKALAAFTPMSSLVSDPQRTPRWNAQFDRAVRAAYEQLQLLAGSGYGVSWVHTYTWMDRLPTAGQTDGLERSGAPGLDVGATLLQPEEHPFPARYAYRRPTIRIEPSIYLDAVIRDFLLFGGHIEIRKFDAPRDLMSLSESLVINCTGLGSRELFADETLIPIKGQLTFLAPQPEINYRAEGSAPAGGRIGVMPRSDGIALGHMMERGEWTLEPNQEEVAIHVERAIALFGAMAEGRPRQPLVASATPIEAPALESFFDLES